MSKRSKRYSVADFLKRKTDTDPAHATNSDTPEDSSQELAWRMLEEVDLKGTRAKTINKKKKSHQMSTRSLESVPTGSASQMLAPPSALAFSVCPRPWMDTNLGKQINGTVAAPSTATASGSGWVPRGVQFNLVSYNILADEYMRTHRHHLYRGLSDHLVSWSSRYPRLLTHMLSLDADVLCLQEVQADHYEANIRPDLSRWGYQGVFKKKTGDKPDGCAIFYRVSKFSLLSHTSIEFRQPHGGRLLDRDNIALVVSLQPLDPKRRRTSRQLSPIVVATTHLLYNPKRSDVRQAQLATLMAELDRIAASTSSVSNGNSRLPCILTGDFNTAASGTEFRLIAQGRANMRLPRELGITDQCKHVFRHLPQPSTVQHHLRHSELQPQPPPFNLQQTPLPPGVTMETGCFTQDFHWRSAYTLNSAEVSTLHQRWVMVDFILYSGQFSQRHERPVEDHRLKLVSRLKLPSVHQVTEALRSNHDRLPAENEPSDHFALAAKFMICEVNS